MMRRHLSDESSTRRSSGGVAAGVIVDYLTGVAAAV
jgi:hypothetical protein